MKANQAHQDFDNGNINDAADELCALLNQVSAQNGIHIDPASALDIENCVVNLANTLGILLPCVSAKTSITSDEQILMDIDSGPSLLDIATIFPNPGNGEFTLAMLGKNKQVKISICIYNALGEIIYKNESVDHHFTYIDISDHAKGIYFVKVIQGNSIYADKIIYQ